MYVIIHITCKHMAHFVNRNKTTRSIYSKPGVSKSTLTLWTCWISFSLPFMTVGHGLEEGKAEVSWLDGDSGCKETQNEEVERAQPDTGIRGYLWSIGSRDARGNWTTRLLRSGLWRGKQMVLRYEQRRWDHCSAVMCFLCTQLAKERALRTWKAWL